MTMRIQEPLEVDKTQDVFTPNEAVTSLKLSLGVQDEVAPTSDTPTDKGLIGLFKYHLQRLTVLIGRLPTALGQQLGANSLSTIGSSQDPVVVAVGAAANSAASADNDATASIFGWLKYLAAKGTSLITLLTSAVGLLTTISSDTSTINTAFDVTKLYQGSTALTVKFASIAASSSGDNVVVPAVTGKRILVLAYTVIGSTAVNPKWRSASTDRTGLLYISGAGGGVSPAFCPVGHFVTGTSEALNINLSGASPVGGHLAYVEIT